MRQNSFLRAAALLLGAAVTLSGCGLGLPKENTKIVLTTGFDRDELFRIETINCRLPEALVYLTNTQNRYEKIYGSRIWEKRLGGETLEESVKETILAELAQVKVMNLLAEKNEVALTEKEEELARAAGEAYFSSLNDTEIAALGVEEETVASMYREYALADKVYHYIIKDINPEISDDEARTITVQDILIKTCTLNEEGERVPYGEQEKQDAYRRAGEARRRAGEGEDFDQLVSEYNEDSRSVYSFGKGEMEPALEDAAFELGTDEISEVVETEYGYHILKCLSTFNREETDANKIKIVEQRRKEVFSQEYDVFVAPLTRKLNDELWEEVKMIHDSRVETTDFFRIYSSYFEGAFG